MSRSARTTRSSRWTTSCCTPHIAGATVEVMARHSQLVADNIRRFCAGEPLVNDLTTGLA